MNLSADLVERLVRDVLAHLARADRGGVAAEPSPQPVVSTATVTTNVPVAAAPPTAFDWSGKIVTIESLRGVPGTVRKLRIPPKAIVTPAAVDRLRELRIEVERTSGSAKPAAHAVPARTPVLWAEAGLKSDVQALRTALERDFGPFRRLPVLGYETVLAELIEEVALGGTPAVLLTDRPLEATLRANRRRGVRAHEPATPDELRRALAEIAVNVLVVDPARRPFFPLKRLIGEFLKAGPRTLPQNWT